jgi:glycosyl transferase family 25
MNERDAGFPPLWVVSLDRSADRRVIVAEEFAKLGLEIEFVPGVDGRALAPHEVALYSRWRALFHSGHGMTKGHFGASLAHLGVYERIVREGIPVVAVFEDDVQPHADLGLVLESIADLPADWQVVTLHSLFPTSLPQPIDDRRIAGNRRVCRYGRTPFGTQGYLITLSGARRLLDVGYPVAFNCDELLYRRHPAGLTRYGIEPTVLAHRRVESEIHGEPEEVAASRVWHRPLEWMVILAGKVWLRVRRRIDRSRDRRAARA